MLCTGKPGSNIYGWVGVLKNVRLSYIDIKSKNLTIFGEKITTI